MGFLHRHILLPAFETLYQRRRTFRYLRELERSQWLSSDELKSRQFESLRLLLRHAYANCPYYRQAWDQAGCDPAALRSPEDFLRWPTIDRGVICDNRLAMRARVPGMRLIGKSTGGSSGEPMGFDLNPDSNERRSAASHRGYGWAGAGPGTKLLYLWGVALGERSRASRWKESLYDRLYHRKTLNSFDLSEERVPAFLAAHNRYRPETLVAYTNPLYEFARLLSERGLTPFSPKSIIVGAEKLHSFQRELIERVFGAPVFETYGSREFMLMAAECDQHQGLHLTQENLLIEVLNDDGTPTPPGGEGNLAVTDLFNYGMPFVRYFNGDRAVAGWRTCSCGRGLPLMSPPAGRVLDVITTPDGRRVPGELFPHLIKDFASVRRFQVVQSELDRLEIRVVASDAWSEKDRHGIESLVRHAVGPLVRLELVRVAQIDLTRLGKLRVVVNLCQARAAESNSPSAVPLLRDVDSVAST